MLSLTQRKQHLTGKNERRSMRVPRSTNTTAQRRRHIWKNDAARRHRSDGGTALSPDGVRAHAGCPPGSHRIAPTPNTSRWLRSKEKELLLYFVRDIQGIARLGRR